MLSLRLRSTDQRAHEQVFTHEVFLRRILLWELRGAFGPKWYSQLGSHTTEIEDRIRIEKRQNIFDSQVSELAYLGLSDLADIVCRLQWDTIFGRVLRGTPKHLVKQELRSIVAMRNKVAHFRPVTSYEAEVGFIQQLLGVFHRHYHGCMEAAVYLSGDPSKSDDQFNTPELRDLQAALTRNRLQEVWDEYGRLEHIRSDGLSPGIGIVDHHIFYEIFVDGSFASERIAAWAIREKHAVTFLTIGKYANYLRAFVPLKADPGQIVKVMKGLAAVAKLSATSTLRNEDEVSADFDFGTVEWLNGEGHNLLFSFVF